VPCSWWYLTMYIPALSMPFVWHLFGLVLFLGGCYLRLVWTNHSSSTCTWAWTPHTTWLDYQILFCAVVWTLHSFKSPAIPTAIAFWDRVLSFVFMYNLAVISRYSLI
jgi:hypothetical protein